MYFNNIKESNLKDVAEYLITQNRENIFLVGDLGSGKTRLTKEICKKLGINYVSSPTFTLINVYDGMKKVYHIDLYRLKSIEEVYDIGLDEILAETDSLKIVEWANLFPQIVKNGLLVEIGIKDNDIREFWIKEV